MAVITATTPSLEATVPGPSDNFVDEGVGLEELVVEELLVEEVSIDGMCGVY
jgi:mycofactocin precursor